MLGLGIPKDLKSDRTFVRCQLLPALGTRNKNCHLRSVIDVGS